jgi:predicted permease
MAPALRAARTSMLGACARGTAGNTGLALRRSLVAVQIALTLVLLFAGLLFLRTFRNLSTLDTGVDAAGVLVANVFLPERRYPVETRQTALAALDDRVRAVSGVLNLAEAFTTPLSGSFRDTSIVIDGNNVGESNVNEVSPSYFATLGTRVIAGRDIDARDIVGSRRVALVNESFAADFLPGAPIGQRFTIPNDRNGPGTEFEVIGVVANQKYLDLREASPRILYTASAQNPLPGLTRRYVIRSARPMPELMRAVSAALAASDPTLSVRYATLKTQVDEAMLRERLMARLSALFGGVALVLATIGLYGVVTYTVARRRAEIGVRVALGASRRQIAAMILGGIGRVLLAGVASGGVLALLVGRGIASLLYGVEPSDVSTLLVGSVILAVAGLISAALPARKAAGLDPVSALREP